MKVNSGAGHTVPPSATPQVESREPGSAGVETPALPRSQPGPSDSAHRSIHEMRVEVVPQGLPRGAAGRRSAEDAIRQLMRELNAPETKESAVIHFVDSMKGRNIDAGLFKDGLLQMGYLQCDGSIDAGQFKQIMSAYAGATEGGGMQPATATEIVQSLSTLPGTATSPELITITLRVLGEVVKGSEAANAAANAIIDMNIGGEGNSKLQEKLLATFLDAAVGPTAGKATLATPADNPLANRLIDIPDPPAHRPPLPNIDDWLVETPMPAASRSSAPPPTADPPGELLIAFQLKAGSAKPHLAADTCDGSVNQHGFDATCAHYLGGAMRNEAYGQDWINSFIDHLAALPEANAVKIAEGVSKAYAGDGTAVRGDRAFFKLGERLDAKHFAAVAQWAKEGQQPARLLQALQMGRQKQLIATGPPERASARAADGLGRQVTPEQLDKHLALLLKSNPQEDRLSLITQACRNAAATTPENGDFTGHAAIWVKQTLPPAPSLVDVNKALKSLEPQRTIPLTDEARAEKAIADALDAPDPVHLNSTFAIAGERTTRINEAFAKQLAAKAFDDLSLRSFAFGDAAVAGISENLASTFKAALKAHEANTVAKHNPPPAISERTRVAGGRAVTGTPPPPVR